MTEKLLCINNLYGTTTGENIIKEVEKIFIQNNLKWNKLKCVTTDGGVTTECMEQKRALFCFTNS